MGARVILENMSLWRRVDARIAIEKNRNERNKEIITSATTMPEKRAKISWLLLQMRGLGA